MLGGVANFRRSASRHVTITLAAVIVILSPHHHALAQMIDPGRVASFIVTPLVTIALTSPQRHPPSCPPLSWRPTTAATLSRFTSSNWKD
ncbi:hypothetical protein NL676_016172 [Syzygium grande]|nr:hypothetical protein NL676_016172 [Syzygium grande]